MTDRECVAFLQWALPRLGLRWPGFRRVRGQVRKRLARRLAALGLYDLGAYLRRLEAGDPVEWRELEAMCRIAISRFWRDRLVWARLADDVLPALAREALARAAPLACWSAGCASGEEPYTLALLWDRVLAPALPGLRLRVLATDVDEAVLERARRACYGTSSLRELPAGWVDACFTREREERPGASVEPGQGLDRATDDGDLGERGRGERDDDDEPEGGPHAAADGSVLETIGTSAWADTGRGAGGHAPPPDDEVCLAPRLRGLVELRRADLRDEWPDEAFDLVLCRNLAFTYFDDAGQREALTRLLERLRPGGVLVIGRKERLPEASASGLTPIAEATYRKDGATR